MKFFKNPLTASAALALALAAASASAQTTAECGAGLVCGVPVTSDDVFDIQMLGVTAGEGVVRSVAEGDETETGALVEKTSGLELKVNAGTCGDCASNSALGTAWEKIDTTGHSLSTSTGQNGGPAESTAAVGNSSVGGVNLFTRIRKGFIEQPSN